MNIGMSSVVPQVRLNGRPDPATLRFRVCLAVILSDTVSIALAFFFGQLIQPIVGNWWGVAAALIPVYLAIGLNANAYLPEKLPHTSQSIAAGLFSLVLTFGSLFLFIYFLRIEQELSRLALVLTMAVSSFLLILSRSTLAWLIRNKMGPLTAELIIFEDMVVPTPPGTNVVWAKHIHLKPDLRDPNMLHLFSKVVFKMDRVIIACGPDTRREWAMMLKGANIKGEVVVDDIGLVGALGIAQFGGQTTLTVSVGSLNRSQRFIKRTFDLTVCVPLLLVLAPLLMIIAIAIKLDSRGPVLFRQQRVGQGNAFFEILKFRSMKADKTDLNGTRSATRDDDRITRVGRLIRRTSFDELPQLFNVLGGSMSLVGPRPHALGSTAGNQLFWDVDQRYWHRHVLKPGITGLAQIRGFRGATVARKDLTERLQSDLEYSSEWSLWKDVFILVSTFRVIVHKNTY